MPRFVYESLLFKARINEESEYTFSVEDSDGDKITAGLHPETPAPPAQSDVSLRQLSNGKFVLAWRPSFAANVSFTLLAEDSRGAKTSLRLLTSLCACENGGQCTNLNEKYDKDLLFTLQGCRCKKGELTCSGTNLALIIFLSPFSFRSQKVRLLSSTDIGNRISQYAFLNHTKGQGEC